MLALPRSGTAWAANWLSCDGVVCIHEPLTDALPENFGDIGIACTGTWLDRNFLDRQTCPRIILERDVGEINASLESIGLPCVTGEMVRLFNAIPGPRFHWTTLFEHPDRLWTILRPESSFDRRRHRSLCELNIQRNFKSWRPDPRIYAEMFSRAGD